MFDADVKQIDAFTCRQDLWTSTHQFVVRLRRLGHGAGPDYEDRGALTNGASINGRSGFGGELRGHVMKNNAVFLEGTGGSADYVMVANPNYG
jgi:hypothetical protein